MGCERLIARSTGLLAEWHAPWHCLAFPTSAAGPEYEGHIHTPSSPPPQPAWQGDKENMLRDWHTKREKCESARVSSTTQMLGCDACDGMFHTLVIDSVTAMTVDKHSRRSDTLTHEAPVRGLGILLKIRTLAHTTEGELPHACRTVPASERWSICTRMPPRAQEEGKNTWIDYIRVPTTPPIQPSFYSRLRHPMFSRGHWDKVEKRRQKGQGPLPPSCISARKETAMILHIDYESSRSILRRTRTRQQSHSICKPPAAGKVACLSRFVENLRVFHNFISVL